MKPPVWHVLWLGETYNPRVVEEARGASGAYAVRDKRTHAVQYVGESHTGSIWKTMLRHFQGPDSFRAERETVFTGSPDRYEVALHITSRGPRPRLPADSEKPSKRLKTLRSKGVKLKKPDQRAMAAQARWIKNLRPAKNKDDGMAAKKTFAELRASRATPAHQEGAFDSLLNPSPAGALVELGKLTRLEQTSGTILKWSLRQAPALAYDDAGRLFIVYTGKIVRSSTPAEIREYGRTHWGRTGKHHVRNGGVAQGPFVRIGTGKSVTYTTEKGVDLALVDYVHPWGEGASAKGFVPPIVVEHECVGGCRPRCADRGAIALQGGSYRVTGRGIVG